MNSLEYRIALPQRSVLRFLPVVNAIEQQALAELALAREHPFRLADHLGAVRAASALVVVLLWEVFGRQVNPLFLSYPSAIFEALLQLLKTGEIQRQAIGSLHVFAVGLSGALVLGILLGLLMGRYRLAEYLLVSGHHAHGEPPTTGFRRR